MYHQSHGRFQSRPHSHGSRHGSFHRGGIRGRQNRSFSKFIHPSKFVNKVQTQVEEVVFQPTHAFTDFKIAEQLKSNIIKKGYIHPTPIQDQCIVPILEGRDVLGIANTGTGKTAAFGIPLVNKTMQNKSERVLIMAPTRELAMQIKDEIQSFARGMMINTAICIGGASMRGQMYELRRNPQFVIGTPGRLKDLVERRAIDFSKFGTIVLDEVDRMLDMGFIKDIQFLISYLPPVRQTLFFSATINKDIEGLINTLLKDPIKISVKTRETAQNVDQDVIRVSGQEQKFKTLYGLLQKEEFKKVLVFGRTKYGVEKLSNALYQQGVRVGSIHGNKPQAKRQQVIRMFKEDVIRVLVATDVAARGLDVPNITHVINFDQPATYEDYVHRIGRTGRANNIGHALTFVD